MARDQSPGTKGSTATTPGATQPGVAAGRLGPAGNLALMTVASLVCFWAWNSIGPLSATYSHAMDLSSSASAILVAMPVLVGSLGRIPVGALTDRYGGRLMMAIVCFAAIVPVLLVGIFADMNQYVLLLISALLLGVAGTCFAVGIPFVNAWYPPARRGFAAGVFGMGMVGTAVAAFFTPRFVNWFGGVSTHVILAVALAVVGVLVLLFARDSPAWQPQRVPFVPKLVAAAKLPVTWNMCVLYGIVFGGFVAFSSYLPTYLKTIHVYNFTPVEAGSRVAVFALAAVIARPIGGAIADRISPKIVVLVSLAGTLVMAALVNIQPRPELSAGLIFCTLAFFLGIGTGGVFAWLTKLAPPERVGTVTGLVSAAGGLGGYFPPLVMGATYNAADNNYHIGLLLLCIVCAVALVYTIFLVPADDPTRRVTRRDTDAGQQPAPGTPNR